MKVRVEFKTCSIFPVEQFYNTVYCATCNCMLIKLDFIVLYATLYIKFNCF